MHSYYDSDVKQKNNNFSYIVIILCCLTFIVTMTFTSLYNRYSVKDYIDYNVVIMNDHDVILYNVDNEKDSICLRLENAYNLSDEWMIQVKQ